MLRTRVIPVLLLSRKGLVKTIGFGKARYIGDPINAVRIFNEKEVDELVFLDIDASKLCRRPDFDLVRDIASECFMPLAYGGGITDMEDIRQLFFIGVEKVIINTAALVDPELITQAAGQFGSQSIVVMIDTSKNLFGKYTIYSHSGMTVSTPDVLQYAQEMERRGAGEIIINSVNLDGTMSGFDVNLIERIASAVKVPVVACGGAGKLEDLRKAWEAGASAIAAGSLFVYHGPHRAVLINYPSREELKELFN